MFSRSKNIPSFFVAGKEFISLPNIILQQTLHPAQDGRLRCRRQ